MLPDAYIVSHEVRSNSPVPHLDWGAIDQETSSWL